MATSIFVLPPELLKAAHSMEAALSQFDDSTTAVSTAATALYAGWAGSAQAAFQTQEEASRILYKQMSTLVGQFAQSVLKARAEYISTDVECAQLLRSLK
ncbi:MAG: hypothetical protein IJ343_01050 [Clostridia bacterium]|nr:hypothetical protein [Clostridia bacterium]